MRRHYLEKIAQRAIKLENAIDASEQAKLFGLNCTVAIASDVWNTLLAPFPSAFAHELLHINPLLHSLHDRLISIRLADHTKRDIHILHFSPPKDARPRFLTDDLMLRATVLIAGRSPKAVLIDYPSKSISDFPKDNRPSLPAALAYRLLKQFDALCYYASAKDAHYLDSIRALIEKVTARHPLILDLELSILLTTRVHLEMYEPEPTKQLYIDSLNKLVELLIPISHTALRPSLIDLYHLTRASTHVQCANLPKYSEPVTYH